MLRQVLGRREISGYGVQSYSADIRYEDGSEDLVGVFFLSSLFFHFVVPSDRFVPMHYTFTETVFFLSHDSVLADDSAGKSGDLYIRSVCFSPDSKYLATGADDKQIRVRFFSSLL